MAAGTAYVFSVQLTNDFSNQSSPVEIIATSTSEYVVSVDTQYMDNDNQVPTSGIYNAIAGDLNPMKIRNVLWEIKNIGQSSPYPCATNRITTTLQPSVPLFQSCVPTFSLTGLQGAKTPSGAIALTKDAQSNLVLQTAADWTQASGTLVVKLDSNPMVAGQSYVFSFDVVNGISHQASPVSIAVDQTILTVKSALVPDMSVPGLSYDIYQAQAGDLAPMYIRTVEWSVRNIGQTSPYPCAVNTIKTTLRPSVPIFQSCLSAFTLSGLVGSETESGTLLLSNFDATVLVQEAAWTKSSGKLVVNLKQGDDHPMLPTASYTFDFTVTNSFAAQHSPVEVLVAPYQTISEFAMNEDMSIPSQSYDLYMPAAGDLRPMFIRNRTWEVKNIGQRTPYPCARNTISVTLQPSVPFHQRCLASFTITGLLGAHPNQSPSGTLALSTLHSTVLNSSATWRVDTGQVTVRLVHGAHMVAGTAYTFSFELFNDASPQTSNVELVAASPLITVSQSMVQDDSVPSSAEVRNPQVGDLHPMYIRAVSWETKYIRQSTPYPCAQNTITMTLAPTVPIFQRCLAGFTITGLNGATTPTSEALFPIDVAVDNGVRAVKTLATWQRSGGTLRIDLEEDLTSASPMGAGQKYTISFVLTNPPKPQASTAEIIVATPLITVSSNMDAETGVLPSSGIWNADQGEFQPLYIRNVLLDAKAYQSSPFPCDSNIITVRMIPNVDLVGSCSPQVTLKGLTATMSVGTSLTVSLKNGGVGKGAVSAGWAQATGKLEFSILTGGSWSNEDMVLAGTELEFSFTLTNPKATQVPELPKINMRLSILVPVESFTSAENAVTHITHTPDFSGKVSVGGLTATSEHGKVLNILAVMFNSGSVAATSTTPCADNSITVQLSVNAYLVSTCISSLTLTGFVGSATTTNNILSLVSEANFGTQAQWNSVGTFIIQVTANLLANTPYSFTFTLKNPGAPQGLKTITVQENNVIGALHPLAGGALQVIDVTFVTASITQKEDPAHPGNLYEPCGPNLVEISIRADRTIYSMCNGAPGHLVVSGFSGSSTADSIELVVTDDNGPFSAVGSWSQSAGSIIIFLQTDMNAGTTYTFSFKLVNGQVTFAGHSNIKLQLPHISSKLHALSGTVMQVTNALITPTAFQSSNEPCAKNTISIIIAASFSIRMQCTPTLTVTGLTGTTTQGNAATWSSSSSSSWPLYSVNISSTNAAAYFASKAAWNRATGQLVIILAQDLTGSSSYDLSFQVQNGPKAQSAPALQLSSASISIYSVTAVLKPDSAAASAAALSIEPLTFTVKHISQSSWYPCGLNVITVSLKTSVGLLNTCRVSETNIPYNRYPRVTIAGLTGTRKGTSPSAFTSSLGSPFSAVNSTFNVTTGTLVFVPVGDVQSTTDYSFSFTVRNQATQHTVQAPSLSVDIVNHSPQGMNRPASIFTQPMYVGDPTVMTGTRVHQSNDNPCSMNTITVSIKMNVPVFKFCQPSLTFTGLLSYAETGPILDGSTLTVHSIASWSQASGKLVTRFTNDITVPEQFFTVVFNVRNPSLHQNAPGMTIKVTYQDSGGENLPTWSPLATTYLDGAAGGGSVAFLATNTAYPGFVKDAVVTSSIGQSSPFPCDSNSITVTIASTVDLELTCVPSISISGLTGSFEPDSSTFTVGVSVLSSSWTKTDGSWQNLQGNLVFNVMDNSISPIAATSTIVVSFILKNPNTGQAPPPIWLQLRLKDSAHATADEHFSEPNKQQGTDSLDFNGKSACTKSAGDAFPLYVKTVGWLSGSTSQSTSWPCYTNTITVSFQVDAPLFLSCVNQLTLSGLTGSTTGNTGQLGVQNAQASMISGTAGWTNSANAAMLVLALSSNLLGCTPVTFAFDLTNPSLPQSSPDVTLAFTASAALLDKTAVTTSRFLTKVDQGPLYVQDTAWNLLSISSTSYHPCAINTITISMRPIVPLMCNAISLVFSGLGSSRTDGPTIALISPSAELNPSASWTKSKAGGGGGELTVVPTNTLLVGVVYSFSFSITNADTAQAEVTDTTLTVRGGGSEKVESMDGSITAIVSGEFRNPSTVRTSTTQPCGANRIEVCLTAFPVITKACVPSITVTGLLGLSTPSTVVESNFGALSYSSLGSDPIGHAYAGPTDFFGFTSWNKDTGVLVLQLTKDLASATEHCVSFVLQNQREAQPTRAITVNPSGSLLPFSRELTAVNSHGISPLVISRLEFNTGSSTITQSNRNPCAPNVITICLRPTVMLLNTCRDDYNAGTPYNRHPWITISGLQGTKTTSATLVLENPTPTIKFATPASWSVHKFDTLFNHFTHFSITIMCAPKGYVGTQGYTSTQSIILCNEAQ